MLTVEQRRRIRAEEEERLRVRRVLERQRAWTRVPWAQLLAIFVIGALLGFALISLYPEPANAERVIVVDPAGPVDEDGDE